MGDRVRKVHYYSILVTDRPGATFGVLSTLVSAGINLIACNGFPRGKRAQIDVVPDDTRKFERAVKKAGLDFTEKKSGFLIQGEDRPGVLAAYLKKLAEGKINVTAVEALTTGSGRWGAIVWVKPESMRKAGTLLGAEKE